MRVTVTGTDQFGRETSFQIEGKLPRPSLYFWLGAEAEPKRIAGIIPAAPDYLHEYRYIQCGFTADGRWVEEYT